jgi:pantoate--beta-alanine ligase
MKTFHALSEWREFRRQLKGGVGFVPTMGALHEGHAALLKKSRAENAVNVLSIFVNPTQFNDPKDFEKYPVHFEADAAIAEKCGVDYILYPPAQEIYQDDYRFRVTENQLSQVLEKKTFNNCD